MNSPAPRDDSTDPLDLRVKVYIEQSQSYSVYPRPDMRFYLVPSVLQLSCKGKLPSWAKAIEKGKKIHIQTEEGLYDLNNPEEAKFWNNLDTLLKTEKNLIIYLKYWKPASEKGKPRGQKELEGVFTFDYATPPCIIM